MVQHYSEHLEQPLLRDWLTASTDGIPRAMVRGQGRPFGSPRLEMMAH